ncbi:MAG: hypothetical protein U1E65_02675 [Myxococcota bacterium]
MRGGWSIAGAALWALTGCAAPSSSAEVELSAAAAAGILAVRSPSSDAWTLTVAGPLEPRFIAAVEPPLELLALEYSQALAAEALTPPRDCGLLQYARARRGHLEARGEPISWSEVAPGEAEITALLLGADTARCTGGCWGFQTEVLTPIPVAPLAFAASTGTTAIFGYQDGSLIRVGEQGEGVDLCGAGPNVTAGAWHGGDTLWLGLSDGSLATLRISAQRSGQPCAIETSTASGSSDPIVALDVSPPEMTPELFALNVKSGTGDLRFFRYAGGRIDSELHQSRDFDTAVVLWLRPGAGIAALAGTELIRIDQGAAEIIPIALEAPQGIRAMSLTGDEAGGAWIGVERVGPVHFTLPDAFTPAFVDRGLRTPYAIARFPDRVLISERPALLAQSPFAGARCPDVSVYSPDLPGASYVELHGGTRVGTGQLVFGAAETVLTDNSRARRIIRVHW